MSLTDRIDELCSARGIENRSKLSKLSGIPYTTLDSMYRIGCDNVKLSTLEKLAKCLDTTIEYLANGNSETNETNVFTLSPTALHIAQVYDTLPPLGRAVMDAFVTYAKTLTISKEM